MGCPFSPAGAARDPGAQPGEGDLLPRGSPRPRRIPRAFLEETRTGGTTSPHRPDPPSPPVGFPRKPRLGSYITWGSPGQFSVPRQAEGEILQQVYAYLAPRAPKARRQGRGREGARGTGLPSGDGT